MKIKLIHVGPAQDISKIVVVNRVCCDVQDNCRTNAAIYNEKNLEFLVFNIYT